MQVQRSEQSPSFGAPRNHSNTPLMSSGDRCQVELGALGMLDISRWGMKILSQHSRGPRGKDDDDGQRKEAPAFAEGI
jgi:hypothetical protein